MTLKKKRALLVALIVLTVVFIWGNSLMPSSISHKVSGFVMKLIGLERETGGFGEKVVRKMGHFVEFFALGAELTLFLWLWEASRIWRTIILACCTMFFPIIDETLQGFNDRHSLIRDVWIDMTGFVLGCALMLVLQAIFRRLRERVLRRKEGERGDRKG